MIVKFGAEWCVPCKRLDPVLTVLADEGHEVHAVDVDEVDAQTLAEWQVLSVPMTFFLDGEGNTIHTLTGAVPPHRLRALL